MKTQDLETIEDARQMFMRGETSANEYWDIRVKYLSNDVQKT